MDENYTRVPNVIFNIYVPNMNNMAAIKCFFALVKLIWGQERNADWIVLSNISRATNLSKKSVYAGMKWLNNKGYISLFKTEKGILCFMCDIDEFRPELKQYKMIMKKKKISKSKRKFIFKRDNYTCIYCGDKSSPLEIDHIYPESRGGDGSRNNLACACEKCNRLKSNRLLNEWRNKWNDTPRK